MAPQKPPNLETPPPRLPPHAVRRDWPRWLEPDIIVLVSVALYVLLRIYYCFLWGNTRGILWYIIGFAIYLAIHFGLRYFSGFRDLYYPLRPQRPTFCATCNYDLRATPLRCPECGTETPLKRWLDRHPLDRLIYEKRLTPSSRRDAKKTSSNE